MTRTQLAAAVVTLAVAAGALSGAPIASAAPLTDAGFITADGNVLRTGSGSGDVINLRGTNIGGWLAQEDWMSPLGEFAADRTGWSATASAGNAAQALDGNASTRWSTGAAQAGGESLTVDLGAATLFNRLSIGNTAFPGDYPRQLTVDISDNGTTWRSVAAQPGSEGVTTVRFTPQVAPYIRLAQHGSAGNWWSVDEVNVFSDPVLHNGKFTGSASTTASGTTPARALDGNITTVWQSGAAQAPGQTFTVDLGKNTDMDKVLFDAGAATANDYPRNWDVFVSTDNSSWTKVSSGTGTGRTVLADFNGGKSGRYLRIQSNGTASQWWSVADIAIYSGTEADRGNWTVSASMGATPTSMIDGDADTHWATGAAQTAGQSVTVDMGALATINNVSTDTGKNSTYEQDWARGYTLELSRDGSAWSQAATGVGAPKATTIAFPAQAARYFRLTQTGSSPDRWWSIGELTAGLHNDDYSLNRTLLERFGASTAQSIIDTHQDTWFTEADMDRIAATGMNFVRLPVGWGQFLNLDGSWKADPWKKIDAVIAQAKARGMYVLVDLHTVPGGGCPWGSCGRMGPNPNGFWGEAGYQNWVEDIWKAIATRYKGEPAVAGYDLINEPLLAYGEDADDVTQKNDYYDRLYRAVRAIDPDHLIVLGAFFDLSSLAAPSVYGWTNVMYELHPYDMANQKDWAAQNQLVTKTLDGLQATLASPGVPMLYGEYSLYYNDDVWARFMAGLNAAHASWSNWSYKVRGSAKDGFGYWGMYYDNANPVPIINSDDAATFQTKLQRFGTENFSQNDRFVATVSKYAGGNSAFAPVEVSHAGWSATASSTASGSSAARAIDGANGSSWKSGQAMTGGEWLRIDMGSVTTVAMVTVQTASDSVWDFPRAFTVETSTDGTSWSTAATGVGYGWKRPISIAPTSARYLRITQTGTAPQWWTVDEVSVYSSY